MISSRSILIELATASPIIQYPAVSDDLVSSHSEKYSQLSRRRSGDSTLGLPFNRLEPNSLALWWIVDPHWFGPLKRRSDWPS